MPPTVITHLDQVTAEWLTRVLVQSGALAGGAVAVFETEAGRGNWSAHARLRLRYSPDAQGARPGRLFLKLVNADLGDDEFFGPSEVTYYTRDYADVEGAPVSRADYELAYRAMRDPAVRGAGPFSAARPDPFPACGEIAGVEFLGDAAYRVTWKPGFSGARLNGRDRPYFLPPFSRVPARQVLDDGRRLAEAPPAQWFQSDAVMRRPLGVGPYVVQAWVNGQSLTLTANPHYFQGRRPRRASSSGSWSTTGPSAPCSRARSTCLIGRRPGRTMWKPFN